MKKIVFCSLLAVFSLILTVECLAENKDRIAVKAEVDKASITIGERITYTVSIRRDPSVRIVSPVQFPNTRDFEVKVIQDIKPATLENGLILERRGFVITAYTLGEYVIEGARVEYADSDNVTKTIQTDQLYITVESVDKSGKEKSDIRAIKGTANITSRWLKILLIAVFLAGAAGAISFLIIRKFFIKNGLETEPPPLPPYEEASEALLRLFESDLIHNKQFKTYYFRFSEIMRRYLERRYEVRAVEMTTMEILFNLKSIHFDEAIRKKIGSLLANCDLVKFAKYLPEEEEIEADQKISKDILEATKPAPEPEQTSEATTKNG
ncbi:MAG: hypothetical protein PHE61_01765 [Candidatus Omnitrophica bacterium]|nr:hypothetical protein [Candidatus Omnitrophota bacterium]